MAYGLAEVAVLVVLLTLPTLAVAYTLARFLEWVTGVGPSSFDKAPADTERTSP